MKIALTIMLMIIATSATPVRGSYNDVDRMEYLKKAIGSDYMCPAPSFDIKDKDFRVDCGNGRVFYGYFKE